MILPEDADPTCQVHGAEDAGDVDEAAGRIECIVLHNRHAMIGTDMGNPASSR